MRNNHFYAPADTIDHNQYDMKFDWNVTTNNRWFARYSIRDEFVLQNGSLPLPANGGNGQTIDLPGQNWASALHTTLSPTMFNELRFGYTFFPTRFDIPFTEPLNGTFGVLGAPGDSIDDGLDHGYALSTVSGFQAVGPRAFWPNVNKMDNLQISDNFTWVRGSHTIKFGGEYRRTQIPRSPSRFRRGRFQYTGVYTAEEPNSAASRGASGNALADGLLGWNNNGRWGWPNGEEQVIPYWGFFVQDDWKLTNRLTLNLGLRYELFLTPTFPDPQSHTLNSTVVRFIGEANGRAIDPGERMAVNQGGWGEAQYLPHFQTPSSGSDCACENDLNNFAPRIGLAYRVNNSTVVRVGIGMFYGEHDNTGGEAARFNTGAPQSNEFDNNQPRNFSTFFTRDGFPASTRAGLPRAGLNVNVKKDGVWPSFYAAQWFFDIQRELPGDTLLTVGYNGSSTSQIHGSVNINRPLTPHPTVRWQARRIRPFFNSVGLRGVNFLNQNYNSLTVKAEKRFTDGFTFLSSFTWAHNIDVVNENLTTGTTSQQRFTYNQGIERGNASLDRRLAYVTSVVYELPFGHGKNMLSSGPGAWVLGRLAGRRHRQPAWRNARRAQLQPEHHERRRCEPRRSGRGDQPPQVAADDRPLVQHGRGGRRPARHPRHRRPQPDLGAGHESDRLLAVTSLQPPMGGRLPAVPFRGVQLHEHAGVRTSEHLHRQTGCGSHRHGVGAQTHSVRSEVGLLDTGRI